MKLWDLFSRTALLGRAPLFTRAFEQVPLLAIDLELTSLEIHEAEVTSIGWVAGRNHSIDVDSGFYRVLNTHTSLGQSPVIHGLTPEVLEQGSAIETVIPHLLDRLHTHVLVFHNASLDLAVLDKVFNRLSIPSVEVYFVDTLRLAVYQLNKRHQVIPDSSATLSACRARLSLPDAPAHNAMDDAFATLQLCYAQMYELGVSKATSLNELIHTRALGRYRLGVLG